MLLTVLQLVAGPWIAAGGEPPKTSETCSLLLPAIGLVHHLPPLLMSEPVQQLAVAEQL